VGELEEDPLEELEDEFPLDEPEEILKPSGDEVACVEEWAVDALIVLEVIADVDGLFVVVEV